MRSSEAPRVPYPGLRPFEACEADLFFGREQHVDALLTRLSHSHFVAVVGESGSGKSSLVRAGLLPALQAGFVVEAGADWRVAVMRPGGSPLSALADSLLQPGVLSEAGGSPRTEFALAELRRGPLGLVQLVRDAHLDKYSNLLIVVDQFEELFRYCHEPAEKDQADVFVELLLHASRQRQVPVFVVLTMRSDFIGDCARFRGLPEVLNDNQYLTPRLTRDQLAAAIREPARVCGGVVDPALVDELCNAVGDDPDQLPLLQHLLMRTWQGAIEESTPPRLTAELARRTGGLYSALNDHAQQIYESLTGDRRVIARAMFKSLTDPLSQRRDLRRDARVQEIAAVAGTSVESAIAVADAFRDEGRHMLMPPPTMSLHAGATLDISHESLIRQWKTLNAWSREESVNAREFLRLREEAEREQTGEGELLSGRSLARALDWLRQAEPTPAWAARYAPPAAFDATLAFVRKSEAEAERRKLEQQRIAERDAAARRASFYSWLFGGALLVATAVTIVIFALWQEANTQRVLAETREKEAIQLRTDAEDNAEKAQRNAERAKQNAEVATTNADEAKRQEKIATTRSAELAVARAQAHSRQLAANAQIELQRDPALAVLLARKALVEGDGDEQIVHALRDAIAQHVPNVELPFDVAKSRNYIPGRGKEAWLDFSLHEASLSPRGDLIIVPSGNDARISSTSSLDTGRVLRGHEGLVASAGFSPDGKLAVTASGDNSVRLWDVATGKLLPGPPDHKQMVNAAVFNPAGTLLVTLGDDDLARVWNTGDYATPRCELRASGNFITASFSHDQTLLVTVTHNAGRWRGQLWSMSESTCPERTGVLDRFKNLRWASFSPHGPWLGAVTTDGAAIVLNTSDTWSEQERIVSTAPSFSEGDEDRETSGGPPPLAWSADGQYFAAGGLDQIVRIGRIAGSAPPIQLRGHTGRVTSITFHPTDDILLTTSVDRTARLWRLSADKRPLEVLVLRGHGEPVGSGAFSATGNAVVTAGDDGRLRFWTPRWGLSERGVAGLRAASFSDDGRRIWVRGVQPRSDGRLLLQDLWFAEMSIDKPAAPNESARIPSRYSAFHEYRILYRAVDTSDGSLSVLDVREPSNARPLADSRDVLPADTASSPDGRFVVARTRQRAVKVWDLNAPQPQPQTFERISRLNRPCEAKGISNDQRIAWYCAEDNFILVSRPGQSPQLAIRIGDQTKARTVRFSTDGRWLAVTFEDYSIRVLDTRTGRNRPVMRGHDEAISAVDFSADGRFLVSASGDGTVRVWDVMSGTEIARMGSSAQRLRFIGAAFHPDGRSVLLVAPDRLLLWRCYGCGDATALLNEVAGRRIVRGLSADEEIRFGLKSHELNSNRRHGAGHPH